MPCCKKCVCTSVPQAVQGEINQEVQQKHTQILPSSAAWQDLTNPAARSCPPNKAVRAVQPKPQDAQA